MNITVDVCGHIFKVKYDIIIKIPYFKNMFDGCGSIPIDTIFVDRSPHIFNHVLGLVIDELYPYPKKYAFELDFYGVDYGEMKLYDKKDDIMNDMKILLNSTIPPHKCPIIKCSNAVKGNMKWCDTHKLRYRGCNFIECGEDITKNGYCDTHQNT
jgi:hypothetical protein